MSAELYFIRLPLQLDRLHRLALERGWLPKSGLDCDEGLALHHALGEIFGTGALKPFRLMVPPRKSEGFVYGYSRQTEEELRRTAALCPPEYEKLVSLEKMDTKPMPLDFTTGRKLGFDIRLRPVRRARKSDDAATGGETDVFVHEAVHRFPDARPGDEQSMEKAERSRQTVYVDWLNERMSGAAEITADDTAKLVHFRRTTAVRNGTAVEGPDAILQGNLIVRDSEGFARLLSSGIGRHKAYGYGMLLLRPPKAQTSGATTC